MVFPKAVNKICFNMKKVLIIGAGIGQTNIVKTARRKGCHVIVVSIQGNYPCITLADDFFECDIYDRDRIAKFAKEHHIDAVISDQNDLMMPTVAYVAEKLSLPGNTLEQQLSYTDKNKFRSICDKINVPVPEHIAVNVNTMPTDLTIVSMSRYRTRNLPAAGALLKAEDSEEKQDSLF